MRNNQDRLGGSPVAHPPVAAATQSAPLSYVVPTEFVELPSRGKFYPPGHPLHGQETIERSFMTAKDEDILSSETLLKKGLAIQRLLESIIVDKSVRPEDLLTGDRNAIMIATRISSYGAMYDSSVTCPECMNNTSYAFDLRKKSLNDLCFDEATLKKSEIRFSEEVGTYTIKLPKTEIEVEVGLITGRDDVELTQAQKDAPVTSLLAKIVKSVSGNYDQNIIANFIDSMPAADSKYLRSTYSSLVPNISLKQEFYCSACAHSQDMEVPLTAEFFWPG